MVLNRYLNEEVKMEIYPGATCSIMIQGQDFHKFWRGEEVAYDTIADRAFSHGIVVTIPLHLYDISLDARLGKVTLSLKSESGK